MAQQVQRAIETYRLPRGTRDTYGNHRLGKCFRDEDELAASPSLPASINRALEQSDSLVLICSPETQDSPWVQREIETFIALHGRERIVCVLAAGDSASSIPAILKTQLIPDAHGVLREMPAEPLAADLRPEAKAKHKLELLRVIAAVAGLNFDDLRQRDRERRRRRLVAAAAGGLALLCLIGLLLLQTHQASQEALIADSKNAAAEAQLLINDGKRIEAIERVLSVLPASSSDHSRPLVPEAQEALERALAVKPDPGSPWRPWQNITVEGTILDYGIPTEHPVLAAVLTDHQRIEVFSTATGAPYLTIDLAPYAGADQETAWQMKVTPGGKVLAYGDQPSSPFLCFELMLGALCWQVDDCPATSLALSEDESVCILGDYTQHKDLSVTCVNMEDGSIAAHVPLSNIEALEVEPQMSICLDEKSNLVYLAIGRRIIKVDLSKNGQKPEVLSTENNPVVDLKIFENQLFASSTSFIGTTNTFGVNVECTIAAFSREKRLWAKSILCDLVVIGPKKEWGAIAGVPLIKGVVELEKPALVWTAGEHIAALDIESGDVVYDAAVASPVTSLDINTSYGNPCLFFSTANGLLDVRVASIAPSIESMRLQGSTGRYLSRAIFFEPSKTELALVKTFNGPSELIIYALDARAEDDGEEHTFDELIDMGRNAIEAYRSFKFTGAGRPM